MGIDSIVYQSPHNSRKIERKANRWITGALESRRVSGEMNRKGRPGRYKPREEFESPLRASRWRKETEPKDAGGP